MSIENTDSKNQHKVVLTQAYQSKDAKFARIISIPQFYQPTAPRGQNKLIHLRCNARCQTCLESVSRKTVNLLALPAVPPE